MTNQKIQVAKVEHVLRLLRSVRCTNFKVPDNRCTGAFMRSFRLVGK